jgi:hypothetical protein
MKNLTLHNPRFITYSDGVFTTDILGGVDTNQLERMVCTLRVIHQNYPPYRSTLDLYNDHQTDKLIRTLCDKWNLKLVDVSKSVHTMITQLESYKLQRLKYPQNNHQPQFELNQSDKQQALKTLKSKTLIKRLTSQLNATGIIGEDQNALILFLALASHKSNNPFSVICLAKSGMGKSYLLQKLTECMPLGSYSFHTQISANALYYFDSHQINNKVLFVEDLEWTTQMLNPLATLQTQGKLIKTRTTKDKDGMFHSTSFELVGKLCLLACAYSDKNYEGLSLPFLMTHLNHSHQQDLAIMEYQQKASAGLVDTEQVKAIQHELKCLIVSLEKVNIINPFAPFIHLPDDISHPRKSLLILLNFIEAITFFHQCQRHTQIDKQTGEISILTHPDDIELAFTLLKNSLFRRADELSTAARGFYGWLTNFLTETKSKQPTFTALDIRKAKNVHPRTLNRYLQELKLYSYLKVVGGNKHRGGFIYQLTELDSQSTQNDVQNRIEQSLTKTLETIRKKASHPAPTNPAEGRQPIKSTNLSRSVSQMQMSNSQSQATTKKNSRTTRNPKA